MSKFIKLGEKTEQQINRMTKMGMRIYTEEGGLVVWVHKDDKKRLGGRMAIKDEPLSERVSIKFSDKQLVGIKSRAATLRKPTTRVVRDLALHGMKAEDEAPTRGPYRNSINAPFTTRELKTLQAAADLHQVSLTEFIRRLVGRKLK